MDGVGLVKTIGLLGGMSWQSTAEYYRLINELTAERLGGLHSARCVLYSVDFTGIQQLQTDGAWDEAGAVLADAARRVEAAGAELLLICTNTMHKVADQASAAIHIPLLHLGDITAQAAVAAGVTTVGLLGTAFTMEQDFYRDRLASHGLDVLVPEPDDRVVVSRVIYDELCRGVVSAESQSPCSRQLASMSKPPSTQLWPRPDKCARRGEDEPVTHDLVISGGTVVDGTGAAARPADVVIDDGRVTAVVEPGTATDAATTIDATGLLVTPGFVDIHTHFDGQATWDNELTPSSWHGVTTIVMGNCGVGFAPVEEGKHDWLIGLMEGVEDIPGTALAEGIDWKWETFPEYLDVLATKSWPLDVGAQIAHGPVRTYVMGERGAHNEPASPDEIEQMKSIVKEAVGAGALGFSMSRTIAHVAIDGQPVPGTFAAEDEIFGICSALGELGKGVVELAPAGSAGEDIVNPAKEVDWMHRLSAKISRPVTFALVQVDDAPDLWRELMETSRAAVEDGADLWAQVAGRPTGLLSGFRTTYCFFDQIPEFGLLKAQRLPWAKFKAAVSDPGFRAKIVGGELDEITAKHMADSAAKTYVLGNPPDYEPGYEKSLAGIAEATGRSPLDVAYDAMLEGDCEGLLYVPILSYSNGNLDHVYEMLNHPRAALGLSDGGAHCGVICDASMPTYMLTHWTRDRTRGETLPLEFIVKKQTHDTARLYGMTDRGTLEPGMLADVNLIDYDGLKLQPPEVVADLPAGGTRIIQRADGYVATIKRGTVTYRNGESTGERPGSLIRS